MREEDNETFFEMVFLPKSLADHGFRGRDEIEDPLDQLLTSNGFGEVTGGGSGVRGTNIDFVLESGSLEVALPVVKRFMRDAKLPPTTRLVQRLPVLQEHSW
ncbi:MAG: hypothetical protein SFU56_00565 [Capsulimonadales bacterium]|nr:hypothetical protein [Capsulimonadales bacterium]